MPPPYTHSLCKLCYDYLSLSIFKHTHTDGMKRNPCVPFQVALAASQHVSLTSKALKINRRKTASILENKPEGQSKDGSLNSSRQWERTTSPDKLQSATLSIFSSFSKNGRCVNLQTSEQPPRYHAETTLHFPRCPRLQEMEPAELLMGVWG